MIKGALFDIDDTLYSHEIKAVPKATLKALDKLHEKGIKIGVCTSRVIAEMESLPGELLNRIDCQIMGTGATTVVRDQYFKSYTIDIADARKYCDYFESHHISYHYTDINGDLYYWGDLEKVNNGRWLSFAGGNVKFKPYEDEEITNLFYYDAADEDIEPIALINPEALISYWGNYGNICAPLIDKSFGLLKFCQMFSLTTDEVVACGDGSNDDVMLEMAGIGIAVENARDNTKAVADYICHKPIEDGGLYDVFVDLKLIEEDQYDIKMFVFDNDSTLYDHGYGGIHESTYKALEELKANGYKLALNTSRSLAECKNIPQRLFDLMDVEILMNGSLLIREGVHEVHYLLQEDVERLINYLDENDITYRYCLKDGSGFLNRHDEDKEALFKRLYDMIPPIKKYEGERVTHILYYAIGQQREEIIRIAEREENCRLGIAGEISAPGCSKGKAMLEVAEEYGFKPEEICAFGDSGNDITMLKMAGLGIAMGNGSKDARLSADYVCEKISDDGIYKALKHFGFIKG